MILEVSEIETFYGQSQALFGVSLAIDHGELVALMGRNGMGKSTTIRSICRLTPNSKGKVWFKGFDLSKLPAFRVARLGIGLVPEGRRCFTNLTVKENMIATARNGEWNLKKTIGLFPRLGERLQQVAATLSGGEQQMLAIARALMTNPGLLILDEATEGLAPLVRREIWHVIRTIKTQGQSLLVVDKTLAELLPVADNCYILEKGSNAWQGKAKKLTPDIQARYLGI